MAVEFPVDVTETSDSSYKGNENIVTNKLFITVLNFMPRHLDLNRKITTYLLVHYHIINSSCCELECKFSCIRMRVSKVVNNYQSQARFERGNTLDLKLLHTSWLPWEPFKRRGQYFPPQEDRKSPDRKSKLVPGFTRFDLKQDDLFLLLVNKVNLFEKPLTNYSRHSSYSMARSPVIKIKISYSNGFSTSIYFTSTLLCMNSCRILILLKC